MRVRCIWNSGPDPCADGGYGETEDYTVNIDLNTAIAENANANWSAIAGAAGSHIIVSGNGAPCTISLARCYRAFDKHTERCPNVRSAFPRKTYRTGSTRWNGLRTTGVKSSAF
ncbi:MAG: hypothetical protein IPO56_11485 [Flavobacteriales bacterium]|nr:hypothetical protein [Flavobacteriales bacterium]